MRRVLIAAATSVVLLGGGFLAFKDQIAMALFRNAIAGQVSTDLVAEYPEGMHVISCGSGTPLPDLSMAGGCTSVIAGGRLFVFDVGDGAPETMARMGLRPSHIEAVFLTHFHSDHIAGLGSLALQRNLGDGITTPLPLYGATGVEQVAAGFDIAFAQDHAYRIDHHTTLEVPAEALTLAAKAFEVPKDGSFPIVYRNDGVTIRAFAVPHGPVKPAVGYRIEYDELSVVISGDTMASGNLAKAAKDADLLVHEALKPEMVKEIELAARASGQNTLATVMHDIPSYHATPVEAAEAASKANVRALAYTHMIPPLPRKLLEGPFLEGVDGVYSGPIIVMHDGMVLTLHKAREPEVKQAL
jgi:ribonuclease Z